VRVTVREFEPGDADAISSVMWRSVSEGAAPDYSPAQRAAWLPEPPGPSQMLRWAGDGRSVFVAVDDGGTVVGYTDLESDGHIDHLYCSPEAIGTGAAGLLHEQVEACARQLGLRYVFVEASEAARRFYEARGFVVDERREWDLRGVRIHNYAMSKQLTDDGEDRHHRP
jgi:putative acetyltransferase